ncbi:MAG: cyclic nucleotide-binding domain-containing protein [Anaerolineaceae bacterium]
MSIQFEQVYEFIAASPFFNRLDESERRRLVREFDVVSLPQGQILFQQNAEAEAFYFVLDGKLVLSRQRNRRIISEVVLKNGDPVGEEAFIRGEAYRSSASAAGDTILLRIRGDRLSGLIDQYPRLAGSRNLISGTHLLSKVVNLDWLNHDERVVLINRKNPFFLTTRVLIPCLVALIGLIVLILNLQGVTHMPQPAIVGLAVLIAAALLWIFWISLDWANDYYILTTKRLVRVDRAIAVFDWREEIPLGNIMSVEINTTPLGKMFAFADITSRTYNVPVVWHGISNPDLVAALIQLWVERAKSTHEELEMGAMQAALDRQLGGPDDQVVSKQPGEQIGTSVTAGARPITFRKHWVILLRKTWFPFTFGVAGIFTLLGGFSKRLTSPLGDLAVWLIGAGVLFLFIWYLYQFLDWRNDTYQISADQIMDVKRTPLGREDRKTAPLENILSINYRKRGLMGLLLNYGTVNIQVGTESLIFDYVRDPSGVQREIFRRIADRQTAMRQAGLEAERDRMSQWIAAYHRRVNE